MATIYISIGSNINPKHNIQFALADLEELFGQIESSSSYESKSIGFEGDNFINLVVRAETDLDIASVNEQLHAIEDQHGRDRSGRLPPAGRRGDVEALPESDGGTAGPDRGAVGPREEAGWVDRNMASDGCWPCSGNGISPDRGLAV